MSSAATLPPAAPLPPPAPDMRADLRKALTLIRRSPSVRRYLLDASSADADVRLLVTPRPAFTIVTEEEQVGALQGCISLRYLGVPAFAHSSGLSGGAVVTSYAARTHPLHAPQFMSDVRVGRYVRDEATGEWCIVTRNLRDRLTRLQYVRVSNRLQRERICLTCSSDLFDAGQFLKSVLFKCHDTEWRQCPTCAAPSSASCTCVSLNLPQRQSTGLAAAAGAVMREGPAKWYGKVRVTVVNTLHEKNLCDIDACMDVRATYEPSMDSALAADMQRLAIFEKVSDCAIVPAPLSTRSIAEPQPSPASDEHQARIISSSLSDVSVQTPPDVAADPLAESENPSSGDDYFINAQFYAPQEAPVVEDPFMPSIQRYEIPEFLESAMLPADPSTLPGGIELCMDGMDIEEDWDALLRHEKETSPSTTSSIITESYVDSDQKVPQPHYLGEHQSQHLQQLHPSKTHPETAHNLSSSHSHPLPNASPIQSHFQPPSFRQFPWQQQLSPTGVLMPPVAPVQSPVVPKEEAVLSAEPMEMKPQFPHRGVTLAPRPAGMAACSDGFIWQMGSSTTNNPILQARLDAMEKERKAEERRKKNRQAAARSNARKKSIMDGYKSEIKAGQARIAQLRRHELELKQQNQALKRQVDTSH